MNKNLQSPTKLTEFAPLYVEEKPSTVGQFISKFFKSTKVAEEAVSETTEVDVYQENLPSWAVDAAESPDTDVYPVDGNDGKGVTNVLKRISGLLALKSKNLKDYEDTEMKQYWMPDSVSKECYKCCEKFTTFRRRHHCRVCGQIFCSQCCNQQIPGKIFGCTGDLRVCTNCCKVVLSYLQSSDGGLDLTTDLKVLQESLQTKFGDNYGQTSKQEELPQQLGVSSETGMVGRKISVGYQEEKFVSESSPTTSYLSTEEKYKALQNSSSLRNLFEELSKPNVGVPLDTHRYRLRTYTDCFSGSDLIDWLIFQQKAKTRIQAFSIGQALFDGGYIKCVAEPCPFTDGVQLYKYGSLMSLPLKQCFTNSYEIPNQEEPIWVQQIPHDFSTTDSENEIASPSDGDMRHLTSSSSYMLDLNVEANSAYITCPDNSYPVKSPESSEIDFKYEKEIDVKPSEHREIVPEAGWHNTPTLREDNGEKLAYNLLTETYDQHEINLLRQLLSTNGLSLSWCEVILKLVHEVIDIIRPDKNHNAIDLDIRTYVQFKKLPGGKRSDTTLVKGIVCSKNVAHKGMVVDIEDPKILVLQCAIVYQRNEGRLMSLEPVLMQEQEYLRHVTARISAMRPDVVLVQRNVSRLAQESLLQNNVTLVHNVKQTVLDRISRCTAADIVTAVDAHIGRPTLGSCKRFFLKKFDVDQGVKTLMFFDGLPVNHLGCTVILRGGSKKELSRLKKVASFLLFATYNWRLEKSFLMDEFAQPPSKKVEFFDDSKETSPDISISKPVVEIKPDLKTEETKPGESKIEESKTAESQKIIAEPIIDFTDPLHLSYDSNKYQNEKLTVAELPFSNHFKKSLDDTILCVSPFLMFPIPYLETDAGKKCKLRCFFPSDIYYSEQFNNSIKSRWKDETEDIINFDQPKKKIALHPFLSHKITSIEENNVQNLLANFRACGGNYPKKEVLIKSDQTPKKSDLIVDKNDVLDPNNHQRLSVLFCSFSPESENSPAFCVNPWVVCMDFYGKNDIPLGCFLERYCFRSTYYCPSKTCETPMDKHTRRFVHNSGCVSIQLNYFENEFKDENIVMWSWCTKCQKVSPVVPMSADTWSYSFAKYLEMKFYGDVYGRRGPFKESCPHSIHHDHFQYFGYKKYVAFFKYTQVNIWEISLPPNTIDINYDYPSIHKQLIDEIRVYTQKGHEIYSSLDDRIANLTSDDLETVTNLKLQLNKEHAHFKQIVEDVQIKLTSPTIERKSFGEKGAYLSYWSILDKLTIIKRTMVDTIDLWNTRFVDLSKKDKKKDKNSSVDIESSLSETIKEEEPNRSENGSEIDNSSTEKDQAFLDESEVLQSIKSNQRSQSDSITSSEDILLDAKKESDKKKVKTLLSQLLPTSFTLNLIPTPFDIQEHYNLPVGQNGPIVVYENEPSSIIAYALNSFEYKKAFDELCKKNLKSEAAQSPQSKRKSNSSEKNDCDEKSGILGFLRSKEQQSQSITSSSTTDQVNTPEKSDEKNDKKGKNSNIEIQFEDANCNFFCRVYLAEKFAALRSMVMSIGEEAFIRSLSRSIQWNTRGGKSGSNFSKTTDDRFILKEMSRSEVPVFLESASYYFEYMHNCYENRRPTLLGKIVGIYQIIFKNSNKFTYRSNLLVMENLFYNRTITQKFDLKGSIRNRLVDPENQEGEVVWLDENLLLKMTDSPLYVLPHSKLVLTEAIQNDTEFLSKQTVMDYSLLVGLDIEKKELVLGIIDYIRTFTFDKRMEMIFKSSIGSIGAQGKLPTILSPIEYKKRFIDAMHRYFLQVPDHWAGLGKELEF